MKILSNMKQKVKKNNNGFSLIELMIAMAIFAIIVGLIVNSYIRQESQNVTQNQVTEIQQNVRAGFHMIVREIRKVGFDPYGNSGATILIAGTGSTGANALQFTHVADTDKIDNPGSAAGIDEQGELKKVTINLFDSNIDSGGSVDEIQITATGQPIVENINSLLFTYFDSAGVQIVPTSSGANLTAAQISNIRAIQVSLTAIADESERNLSSNRTLVSMIKCRNLGI